MRTGEIAQQIREVADRLSDLEARMMGAGTLDEWARLAAQRERLRDELLQLRGELRLASR